MRLGSVIRGVLAAALLWAPAAAAAADPALAKELSTQGLREFNLGHWNEALLLFERAYKAKPVPGLLYNTAHCHRLLGNLEQARRVYRAYIDQAPDDDRVPAAREKLAEIEQTLERQAKLQQSAPQKLTPPERPPIVQGQLEAASQAPVAPPPTAASPRAPKPRAAPAQALAAPPPAGASAVRIAGWSALAAGVMAAGAGAFFGIGAKASAGDWAAANSPDAWGAARDDAQGKAKVATVSWIAAGVLGAAGVALLALDR
jgi:tetratricopeptide (TPR) repeat protein